MLETLNISNPAQNSATGATNSDIPVSPDISADDQADLKAIMKTFKMWKQVRDQYSKPWLNYYMLFRGKQWGKGRNKKWKTQEVVNLIWQAVQSSAPLQTDVRPRFGFLPAEPSDRDFAELLEKVSEQDWDKWNWMQTVLEVIFDGYIYGTGIASMKYDPSLLYGMGAPVFVSEEPHYIFPDPDCNDINDNKSEGLFHVYPMTTSKLKAKFPKHASKIKSDVKDWLKTRKADVKDNVFYQFYQSTTMNMPEEFIEELQKDSCIGKTLVIEAYLKPNELEEVVTQDQGEKTYTVRKKYPNGRHVVIANGMFLLNEPNLPFEDGLIPYSKYINYCDSREFWGISECEQLESPQRTFNKILSYAIDIMLYCSNPGWIVSNDADVDEETFTNEPGAVIPKSPNGEVRRVEGSNLPPHFFQALNFIGQAFNDIAGIGDYTNGNAPGSVTAASAIEQLIAASRTRIRQKQRNLDGFLKSVGRQYLNRVLEFYTVPRIYRMTNKDGSQYWLKYAIEKQQNPDGTVSRVAKTQRMEYDDANNLITGEVNSMILKGELDVVVHAGSDLPFEAADKERKALAMFDRGIIDAEEVLDQLQYPNREKILERMMQRQEQQAAQQGAAQPGQVPQ